jgi:hypothetical protein
MRRPEALPGAETGGHALLVVEGRSAHFGLAAATIERVVDSESFDGEALDLSDVLDLDPASLPVRVIELRIEHDVFAVKTFGPVGLRNIAEGDLLPLPDLVRRQPGAKFIHRLAVFDGVAHVWVLDPTSLFQASVPSHHSTVAAPREQNFSSIRGDK